MFKSSNWKVGIIGTVTWVMVWKAESVGSVEVEEAKWELGSEKCGMKNEGEQVFAVFFSAHLRFFSLLSPQR